MNKIRFQSPREYGDIELVGNYWKADSDAGIVMAHGFTGNKEQFGKFTEIAENLNQAGFNVLSFDFSGCGESGEDVVTVEKEVKDLKSAIKFFKSRGVKSIGLLGLSQGGLVSLKVDDSEVEAIFLMAPLTDSVKNYTGKLADWQVRELKEYRLSRKYRKEESRTHTVFSEKCIKEKGNIDQEELLRDIEAPVKIVHGVHDSSVPLKQSRKVSKRLENSELTTLEDDHYFEDSIDEISSQATDFFNENMPVSET